MMVKTYIPIGKPISGTAFDELRVGLAVRSRELTGNFFYEAASIPTQGLFGRIVLPRGSKPLNRLFLPFDQELAADREPLDQDDQLAASSSLSVVPLGQSCYGGGLALSRWFLILAPNTGVLSESKTTAWVRIPRPGRL
jgi:hypothetical protein